MALVAITQHVARRSEATTTLLVPHELRDHPKAKPLVIREAPGRLMRGRTVIAIAHRLATLRNLDRVVMLKAGKIIEDGRPTA